jgi:hypothetical protein
MKRLILHSPNERVGERLPPGLGDRMLTGISIELTEQLISLYHLAACEFP